MKKTLKTLINTGLFMLFVSHSYGLIFNLNDVNNQVGIANNPGTILFDNFNHAGFNGIDDTFDGSVTLNFSITFDIYPSGGTYATIGLVNSAGDSPIAIGNSWNSDNWNGFRLDGGSQTNLVFGSNPVVEGQSQAFTMTIDYNAGALDTGTLLIVGDSTTYDIGEFDYSFDKIVLRNGLNNNIVSATNMTVEVVPEPATYALISGALALVFVPLRRRLKA